MRAHSADDTTTIDATLETLILKASGLPYLPVDFLNHFQMML